jgi:hypothetical protein
MHEAIRSFLPEVVHDARRRVISSSSRAKKLGAALREQFDLWLGMSGLAKRAFDRLFSIPILQRPIREKG